MNVSKARPLRLVVVVLVAWLSLAGILTAIEGSNASSGIQTYWDAIWYSLVTLTTVGYGDMYPVTTAGRVIGAVFLLGSLGVLGVLVYKVSERISALRERRRMGHNGTTFTNHVVVIGWDEFARAITAQLVNADRQVAIVTDSRDDIDLIKEQFSGNDVFVLFADLKDVPFFSNARIGESAAVFPNLASDSDKLVSILNISKEFPGKRFVVALDSPDLKETFHAAGVTYVFSKTEIAAKLVASYIFEPDVAEYEADLMTSAKDAHEYDIQQYLVTDSNPFAGKTYGEAFASLKEDLNVVAIGMRKAQAEGGTLVKLPQDHVLIEPGDYLVAIVNGTTEKTIASLFGVQEGVR